MSRTVKLTILAVIAMLILAACAPAASSTNDVMMDYKDKMAETVTPEAMMEKTPEDTMMEKTPEDTKMEKTPDDMMKDTPEGSMDDSAKQDDQMMAMPDWFSAELTNASTGETFTVADFKGKVVLVETMAQWCSNCLAQQKQVKKLHDLLGERDDFVTLGIDIDPNEDLATLKVYIERNQFDWLYTVAPAEVSREFSQLYTDQFLNPPSTPMLIVDRHGEVHVLPFGIKSAEDLKSAVDMYLNDNM